MPVRLKDIAEDLGVSTITVSKVVRGHSDVGEATKKRVLKRMQELNYRPNLSARALASGRTNTAGLIVPDLVHPFFAEFAKSLSGTLRNDDRALILASSEEDAEIEKQEIRTLLSRGVDVLLIASCQANLRNFYELGSDKTPFLLFDRNFPHLAANFIGSDDVAIGELATQHLLEIGRKRIAHIGARHSSPSFDRLRGYQNALVAAGLSSSGELVLQKDRLEESGDRMGKEMMRSLLMRKRRPDAVFCYNDLTAIGAMEAVFEAGLRVPEDVAIIGCGNLRYAEYLRVPLSSIDQGASELGKLAGQRVVELSQARESSPQSVLVAPKLVARASTLGTVSDAGSSN